MPGGRRKVPLERGVGAIAAPSFQQLNKRRPPTPEESAAGRGPRHAITPAEIARPGRHQSLRGAALGAVDFKETSVGVGRPLPGAIPARRPRPELSPRQRAQICRSRERIASWRWSSRTEWPNAERRPCLHAAARFPKQAPSPAQFLLEEDACRLEKRRERRRTLRQDFRRCCRGAPSQKRRLFRPGQKKPRP